jgi:hypothetical protein
LAVLTVETILAFYLSYLKYLSGRWTKTPRARFFPAKNINKMAFCKNRSMITEKLVGQAPQEKLDRPTSGNVFRRFRRTSLS